MARAQLEAGAHLTVQSATLPMALGQKSELIQVVLNLIINAVQAMEDRPKRQNHIQVRMGSAKTGEVWVDVEDNGPGIPGTDLERIFEPFYTSKPVGQGVGLGLAVSRSIVQRMDGRLSVTSSPGKGTCFRVTLGSALEVRPEAEPVSDPVPHVASRDGRVLVIDDNPRVARSIKRMLRRYHVTIAENGPTALNILSEESFDLIICDVMMPGMDGPTVYEHLCELREEQSRRLVFLTGAAKDSGVHAALNATGRRVLSKPTTLAELEALVREFTS
jgi:CheY-like chemotaxis protein/anti-sigma regulatory factor (Ser/Thr protein kinase)